MHRSRLAFSLILATALALTLARAGHCQVEIFLDLDADSATGCTPPDEVPGTSDPRIGTTFDRA